MIKINFDEFTKNNLKHFIDKRENITIDHLKEIKNKIKINKIKYDIQNFKISKKTLEDFMDTFWVYNEAMNNLNDLTAEYKITWQYKSVNHFICIKTTLDKFKEFKNRLNILISMLNYLWDNKNTKEKRPYNIYLVLTKLKKNLPKQNEILGPKHINSGYTDFIKNIIFIWREEEFEKVIFHEVIHYLDLDVRNMAFSEDTLPHHIDGPKSYFEAFTDFWGIFYHLIYLSFILNKSVNSLFQIEYNFIKNQAIMFNNYFELDNWKKKKVIKQQSPAFTYFIVKYLIFNKVTKNGIDVLNNPRDLINELFNSNLDMYFDSNIFINTDSSRMTLLQLY